MPTDLSATGERLVGVQHGFHSGTASASTCKRAQARRRRRRRRAEHVVSFVPTAGANTWKDVEFARSSGAGRGDPRPHLATATAGDRWDVAKATGVWA
jgi:hypothetical protein